MELAQERYAEPIKDCFVVGQFLYILKQNGVFGGLQGGEFTQIACNVYCMGVDGEEVVWGVLNGGVDEGIEMFLGVLA